MALNIVIAPKVRFKVDGSITDGAGKSQPFDFWLEGDRLKDTEEVSAYMTEIRDSASSTPFTDALAKRLTGWDGVKDATGPLAFGDEAVRQVLNLPGMALLVHSRYLRESGAKEKN